VSSRVLRSGSTRVAGVVVEARAVVLEMAEEMLCITFVKPKAKRSRKIPWFSKLSSQLP